MHSSWVEFLVAAGFEAIHWSNVGPGDAPDLELMRWAAAHDRVVLTSDLGYGAVLAATRNRRPSVVQIRADLALPDVMGGSLLAALRQAETDLDEGALLSVDAGRGRLRILPLKA